MRLIHHLWLTVYCKPEDRKEDILKSLRKFIPFVLEDEKIKIQRKTVDIIHDRKVIIFQVHLQKQAHLSKFIKHLNKTLTEDQKRLILKQKESRLDNDNHFFLRFDKKKLVEKNILHITDKGNCYHLKFSIAAFPTTRQAALKSIEQIFK